MSDRGGRVRASSARLRAALAAILLVLAQATWVTAETPWDVRGTWDWVNVVTACPKGSTCPPTVVVDMTITDQDAATGRIAGTWGIDDKVWQVAGTVTGDRMDLRITGTTRKLSSADASGTLSVVDGRLVFDGVVRGEVGSEARIQATLVRPLTPGGTAPPPGTPGPATPGPAEPSVPARRASATLVVCDGDPDAPAGTITCTTLVADASAGDASVANGGVATAPSGTVSWTTSAGTLDPASCRLTAAPGATTGTCRVTFTATSADIPAGTDPPVVADYLGDDAFAPSRGAPGLPGATQPYAPSDLAGPGPSRAAAVGPVRSCPGGVDPVTGDLELAVTDLAIPGRGPGLQLDRTWSGTVATSEDGGRFGTGWTDSFGARLELGRKRVVAHLDSGATVPFTRAGKRFEPPAWSTATLRSGPGKGYTLGFADGGALRFDAKGRLTAMADRSGEPVILAYKAGRLRTATDASGRSLAFTTDAAGRVTRVTDPVGRSVRYGYDDAGDLIEVTDVTGGTTRYAYDAAHRLVSATDPTGAASTVAWDRDGRVERWTDPTGAVTAYRYAGDVPALTTVVTDPTGARTAYDSRAGVLVRETRALGTPDEATTHWIHDERLDLVATVDPLLGLWRLTRDAARDVVAMTDPAGRTTSLTWTRDHLLASRTSPLGIVTRIERDDAGRPVRIVDAAGTPSEQVTTLARDTAHPADVTAITDAAAGTTSIARDEHGLAIAVTDALGRTWRSDRDDLGAVTSVVDPLGGSWTVVRDLAGRVVAATDPLGRATRYARDAAGRVVAIDAPDGTDDAALTLDAAGRRTALQDGTGTTTFTRDTLGRLLDVTDGAGRTVAMTRDARGDIRTIAYPGGPTVEMDRDAAGRIVEVRDGLGHATTFTWDAGGRLLGIAQGNGTVTDLVRNADGDLVATSVTPPGGGDPLLRIDLERDAAGAIVAETSTLAPGVTRTARDAAGRPIAWGDARYAYDAAGDLTTLRGVSLVRDGAGRVVAAGPDGPTPTTYTDDAAGRRIERADAGSAPTAYRWDAAGRLLGADGTAFAVDGDGLRAAAVTETGATSTFTWLRTEPVPLLLGDGSSWFVYGPDGMPIEEIRADGSVRWLHVDADGSVRAMTDEDGALVATATWDPFGALVAATGERGSLGFRGRWTDPTTGFQLSGSCVHDPETAADPDADRATVTALLGGLERPSPAVGGTGDERCGAPGWVAGDAPRDGRDAVCSGGSTGEHLASDPAHPCMPALP